MDSDPIDFSACRQCACSAARRKSRELTRFYDETMRGSGVRISQFSLLATLVQTGPMAATRLAGFLGLERTTLTRNLRPLLRDGLVILEDDTDRRARPRACNVKRGARARALGSMALLSSCGPWRWHARQLAYCHTGVISAIERRIR